MTNNLYNIVSKTPNEIKIKLCDKNHNIFKAHFPNNPILPGFLQIDIIAEILEDKITTINKSKFISHILPNDEIIYNITIKNNKKIIKIMKKDKKISEFTYETN